MKLNGINVSFLIPNVRSNKPFQLCRWTAYHCEKIYSMNKPSIVLHTSQEIDLALSNKITNLSNINKLYFDSASTYPRFKIKDTKFQRVIKVEKCEAAIIPDSITYVPGTGKYHLFEYVFDDNSKIIYSICPELFKIKDPFIYDEICSFGSDFIDGLKTINILPKGSIQIYNGDVIFCDESHVETFNNIVSIYPKYAKENTLDKLVNDTLESITEETILSLNDMLASTDSSVVELGLKILQGLNVTDSPATITCLIYTNFENIEKNKALNTTGVSQVFKSLEIDKRYIPRGTISAISSALDSKVWKNATMKDKTLTQILCKSVITNYYTNNNKQVMEILHNLPFKIKTYVE